MLFAGGMAEASTEDLFAHETRQNPGPLQMRKKPPAVLFQHGNRADFLREQRAKKTTPGREDGAVREDKGCFQRAKTGRRAESMGYKSGLQAQRVLVTFYAPQCAITH